MKNLINISAKALGLAAILIGSTTLVANAQSGKRAGASIISKDVHRVANKRAYNDKTAAPHVVVKSDASAWVQAKDVQRQNMAKPENTNQVISTGTPQWVISKPVRRVEIGPEDRDQPVTTKTDSIALD
jgi:hypothetical protein